MGIFTININSPSGIISSQIEEGTAGELLLKGELCYLSTDQKWYKTTSTTTTKCSTEIRIALENIAMNTLGDLLHYGEIILNNAPLISGDKYYVGDILGTITNNSPIPTSYQRYIGTAKNTGLLLFNPDATYIKGDGTEIDNLPITTGITTLDTETVLINGDVIWQSGLTFYVYATKYKIDGVLREGFLSSTVTLGVADVTNGRIDSFIIRNNGLGHSIENDSIVVIPGIPSSEPAKQVLNNELELEISFATIAANATVPTTPTTLNTEIVYAENIEWIITGATGTINAASTSLPITGTVSILHTYPEHQKTIYFSTTTPKFTNSNAVLQFNIKLDTVWEYKTSNGTTIDVYLWKGNNRFTGRIRVGSDLGLNFDPYNTTTVQNVFIRLDRFSNIFNSNTYDKIQFQYQRTTTDIFRIDNIKIIEGYGGSSQDSLSVPTKTSELLNDGANGVNPFITALDISGKVDKVTGKSLVLDTEIAKIHAALTISATPNGLSLTGQELSLQLASTILTGALSNTDWNTFNGKAPIDSPVFTTQITTPLIVGGSAVGSNIIYKSTTGIGTPTGIAHQWLSGTNGATVIATMLNNGNVGIGTPNPSTTLDIRTLGQGYITIGGADGKTIAGYNNAGVSGVINIGAVNFNGFMYGSNWFDTATNTQSVRLSSTTISLWSASTERLRVANNGNILIGTTTDDTINKLQVNGSGKFTSSVQVGDNIAVASALNAGAMRYRKDVTGSYSDMSMETASGVFVWVNIVSNVF